VRKGERLEGRLVDAAEFLGLVEKRLEIKFSKIRQLGSTPSFGLEPHPAAVPSWTVP
jgi:hypothetical protein